MNYKAKPLSHLLDFARFLGDGPIAAMAAAAEARYPAAELSDSELAELFAAGDPDALRSLQEPPHED